MTRNAMWGTWLKTYKFRVVDQFEQSTRWILLVLNPNV